MAKEKLEKFATIGSKIKEVIKETANVKALDIVIDTSVQSEVDKRAELIMKGLQAWEENEKAIKKCRPDQVVYPVNSKEDGEEQENDVKQEYYSEAKKKELDSLRKRKADLDAALLKALDDEQNYDKLKSLIGGK